MKGKKMASNGFSIWWKGAPADGASVRLFLKRQDGKEWDGEEGKMDEHRERNISGLLFSWREVAHSRRVGGGGERDAVRTTSRLRSNIYQSPSIQSPRACRGWLYRPRNQLTFSVASTFGLNLFFFFFFGDEDTNTGEGAVRREGRGGWGETKTKWAIPDKKKKTRGGFSNICMWIDAALHRQQRWGLYVIADEQCHRAGRLGEGRLRGSRDENHLYIGGGARAVWLCKSKFDCNLRRWFTLRK